MGAGGQPAHQPFAAIGAFERGGDFCFAFCALLPEFQRDWLHSVWTAGIRAAGLMRCQQDIGAEQRGYAHVFHQIIIPADQNTDLHSPGGIKHRKAFAAADRRMLKGVQLAMGMQRTVRHAGHVGVIEPAICGTFDQPRTNQHLMFDRQRANKGYRRAGFHRFRQRFNACNAELRHMPVAGDTHFRKNEDLHAFDGGLPDEFLHHQQVIFLITCLMLKLNHCRFD